jgi:hypothetical protein
MSPRWVSHAADLTSDDPELTISLKRLKEDRTATVESSGDYHSAAEPWRLS